MNQSMAKYIKSYMFQCSTSTCLYLRYLIPRRACLAALFLLCHACRAQLAAPPHLSVLAAPISHAGRAPFVLFRPTIFTRQFRPAFLSALAHISPHHLAINVGLASRSNSHISPRLPRFSHLAPHILWARCAVSPAPPLCCSYLIHSQHSRCLHGAGQCASALRGWAVGRAARAGRGVGGGGKCVNVAEDESGNVVAYRRTGQTCNKRECSCGKKRGNAVTENRDCKERVAVHSPASRVRARPGSRSTGRNPGRRRCGSESLALPVRVTRGPRGAGAGMPCGLRGARCVGHPGAGRR